VNHQQRRHWREQGYLLVRGALTAREVRKLLRAADALLATTELIEQGNGAFKIDQAISRTNALDKLTDHPRVFPLLLDLLGPFLQILGTEIFIRNAGASGPLVEWHTDGGPTMRRFLPRDGNPTLQMKAQFFLTDLAEENSGNFMLVPGSHLRTFPTRGVANPRGAIQLLAHAGDLLLFPWSLWHAVGPNRSGHARRSITFRYGQLWSRPYDYVTLPDEVLARLTPRRRRLFGDIGSEAKPSGYFYADEGEQKRLMGYNSVSS